MAARELKIEYRSISKLKPYAKNARTHSQAQIEMISRSIREFGWTKPIIVDEKGMVLAGHGALEAAKLLGLGSVPVIVRSGLKAAQKRAYILADNKIPMAAGEYRALDW